MLTGVDYYLTRAGASLTPLYQEFAPAPDLRGHVACTWIKLARRDEIAAPHAILPDGCSDIITFDDAPPLVAGPDTVTRWSHVADGAVITAIRLRPGACRAVFGISADALVNTGAPLRDIAPGADTLQALLNTANNARERIAAVEAWVRAALERSTIDDRAVIAACRDLSANTAARVDEAAARVGLHARALHRRFTAACGYSPKHFQRIMRIQRALLAAQTLTKPSLSLVAASAGFADQAHMTRDFRAITGFTPSAWLTRSNQTGWGAWLAEDW